MLESIQGSLAVNSLMTGREEVVALDRGEDPTAVQEEIRDLEINQVPVLDNGDVIGLMIADTKNRALPEDGSYEPIAPKWLVSADTSIRRLIDILDDERHPARFIFQENEVVGLVTYADLNDAVARTALYLLISRLEIKLARLLRQHEKDSWAYVQHLSERRQNRFAKLKEEMTEKDVAHDPIEHFNLSDIFRAVRNEQALREELGFPSKNKFDGATSGIIDMRNDVAHSVKLVVDDIDGIAAVNRRCGRIEELLSRAPSYPVQRAP
ncbi:CBS domain-containing protein [Salinibacter sp.]|uniref:CBS domain-containing protein n=1 Tax=Salinibacter sp. TaxID=2065818 RepID=UPI0021E703AD|nr:CBS domain-containing protein [Salinibacter sp.]